MKEGPKPSRASVLHEVIEEILARKDGKIPTDIKGIDTLFDGIEDLANALLLRWHTRLVASIERGLVDDPEDREEAVIAAWRHATGIYWGVRILIDKFAENPPTEDVAHSVRATARNDWAAMAVAAGLASAFDEPAIRIGHRLELEARRRNLSDQITDSLPRPRTMLGKVKAMLAG